MIHFKPQLIRKKQVIISPQIIRVVTTPKQNRTKTIIVNQINRKSIVQKPQVQSTIIIKPINQLQQKSKTKPPISMVSSKSFLKRKPNVKKEVKYLTLNPNTESLERLQRVRNKGLGRYLIIVGNGPSIVEAELQKLKNHPKIDILSINKPDPRLWPTTHWAFFDRSQMTRNEDLWNSYNGIIFNSPAIKKTKPSTIQIKNLNSNGFSRDLSKGVHIGGSSVYASMQIATWMGYDHVYLFGVDMNPEGLNGRLHFYGVNPDVDQQKRIDRFKIEAKHYLNAAKELTDEERNKFTFCSTYNLWPFVDQYNKLDHREAVDIILNNAHVL